MSTLIHNGTLVLPDRVVPRGWLRIDGNRITQIGEGAPPQPVTPSPEFSLDATHKVVLPGLTNAHTHLEQTFMRGYSANRSLLDWLRNYIWKLQAAMNEDDVRWATLLGMVEAMRGGATAIIDHHKIVGNGANGRAFTDIVLETAERLGVRFVLARAWADRGTNAESPNAILSDLSRLFNEWHGAGDGRIHIANGPLVPWRCTAETLRQTTELARRHNAVTHCHMNETQDEVAMTLRDAGLRPIEWFALLGVLGDDFHAVHGVWLSDQEIKLLKKHNAQVTHCPAANMILASGTAPVARLMRDGVRVALATDGPASNDSQDMIEMMRLAAYLQRVTSMDAQVMPPRAVIDMACYSPPSLGGVGGGQAGLREGALADLTLIDLNAAHIQPVGDVLAALVYNARGSDVDTLIVDGKVLMENKRVVGIDEMALLDECRDRAAHLAKRAGIAA